MAAWPDEQPPDEITRGLFGRGRRLMRTHPLATDTLLAALLLTLSSAWLAGSGFAGYLAASVQAMAEASEVGRRALTDMRAMLGVLRTDEPAASRSWCSPTRPAWSTPASASRGASRRSPPP